MRRNALVRCIKGLTRRARRYLSDRVPDRIMLARRFKREFGRLLNLGNPQTKTRS